MVFWLVVKWLVNLFVKGWSLKYINYTRVKSQVNTSPPNRFICASFHRNPPVVVIFIAPASKLSCIITCYPHMEVTGSIHQLFKFHQSFKSRKWRWIRDRTYVETSIDLDSAYSVLEPSWHIPKSCFSFAQETSLLRPKFFRKWRDYTWLN